MLEHTFGRAEMLLHPERLFTVVGRNHLHHLEVRRQLSDRPDGTVVVQPENKETGPGLLLPLMHLCKRYPNATVAVLPSDHFIADERLFMVNVDLAFRIVERHPSYMVLLGAEPDEPEREYGYILPGDKVNRLEPLAVREVREFAEKPELRVARELMEQGGLWNTFVMVFNGARLFDLVRLVAPALCRLFERIYGAIGTAKESEVTERLYRNMAATNFSRGLLEPLARRCGSSLLVLPVRGVLWSDWGSEQRIVRMLRKIGRNERTLEAVELAQNL
jgi:mannose-1-phosphate guanylyltransferase